MDSREQPMRDLCKACAHGDWEALALLLADDVRWHELGHGDHSGDYLGCDAVVAFLRGRNGELAATFQLEPDAFLHRADHSAFFIGNDIAVYRLERATIAEVWSHVAGYEPEVFSAVSALSRRSGRDSRAASRTATPRPTLRAAPSERPRAR